MNSEFIKNMTDTIARVERAVRAKFDALDGEQLNWRPHINLWSIGQCLEHVMKANGPYFEIFENTVNGTKRATFWERLPLLPAFWGSLVLNSVNPETSRKTRAPKLFMPSRETTSPDIVDSYCRQQRELASALEALAELDLDTHIITSPVASFVTYSLRNALAIIVAHEERHLLQAEKVLSLMNAARPSNAP